MSFVQALQELRTNKLRSALSLTGITIGIFCIIAVLTVIDSLESSIRKRVETLGSDAVAGGARDAGGKEPSDHALSGFRPSDDRTHRRVVETGPRDQCGIGNGLGGRLGWRSSRTLQF